MTRFWALLATITVAFTLIVACTPKPLSADPVAQDFLDALAARDIEELATLTNDPAEAEAVIGATFDGLQAEGLTVELGELTQSQNQATASYRLNWQLPGGRELAYETEMGLTQAGGEWMVRWQPTIVHPQLGSRQHLELRAVPAGRASVVSSDGAELLAPGVTHRLLVDTDKMTDARGTAEAVAGAVNAAHDRDATIARQDLAALTEALEQAQGLYSVTMINQYQGPAVAADLAGEPAATLNEESAMVPDDPGFATDIMARVAPIVSDQLNGTDGWKISAVNANGAVIDDVEFHAPDPAPAVNVSLDHDVQRAAEQALEGLQPGAQGVIVAMRPSTGQMLAVAQTKAADSQGNIGLMGQYPPGSVFKIVTAASGVQEQNLTPGQVVACPGSMNIFGRVVINYNNFSLGNVPLDDAFANSCNTTFADISTQLQPGQLQEMSKSFGLGLDYQIPGLDTVTGSVPEGETPLERTEAGYGQGLTLASPFGMTLASATAAAGQTPTPYLIEGMETETSEEVPAPAPETIAAVQTMMRSVVTSGTAARMQAGGEIHGKTGEAEVNDGSHAWFTGYRDDIAFTSLVVYGGGSNIAVDLADRMLIALDEMHAAREPGAEEEILPSAA